MWVSPLEYQHWCLCWLDSTVDTNLRQSAEILKKLTHLCDGGLVNCFVFQRNAWFDSGQDTRFASVFWCFCTTCSHLECGHHFSARYPAVTRSVSAAPEENMWIFPVMISRYVSVLGEQFGPTMDTRSCVSGRRLGDFPDFPLEGSACYLHALFALGNWAFFFVALFLAVTCSVFVA